MDRGAHFQACDFQVHTPRDIQWDGAGAVTDEEREQFADELIAACRARGLRGIAITDHHEMVMFPYVRRAAQLERSGDGALVPERERIAVFPGMEVTLQVPCQALLIFDADFPEDLFQLVYGALGLNPAPATQSKGAAVERIVHITKLSQLYEELDKNSVLRGRYVVLPNVSEGGTSTLLRSGHAGHYREMPCVGGYLDGAVGQLGRGNSGILSGRDAQYGSRALGLFQTSDCRSRDFGLLGRHRTWVKWAEPTAEALRQACLARDSRISQTEPQRPGLFVTALSLSNSRFLGPQHVDLNAQYNALIGGRGTGKSTLLEYLRWGLCDDAAIREDEEAAGQSRKKLVGETLQPYKATVTVAFSLNGVPHVVRRNSADGAPSLKIGAGDFAPATALQIRELLPVQAYSQKQLSQVSVRLEELRRFLEGPIREDLGLLQRKRETAGSALREARARVLRLRQLRRDAATVEKEIESTVSQVEKLRGDLKGLSVADRETIAAQPKYEQADAIIDRWRREFAGIQESVKSLGAFIQQRKRIAKEQISALPQAETLESARQEVEAAFNRVAALHGKITEEADTIDKAESPLGVLLSAYDESRATYRLTYEDAKGRSSTHQQTLEQLAALETRATELKTRLAGILGDEEALATAESDYQQASDEWLLAGQRKSELLEEQCRKLTELSKGSIRARLHIGAGAGAFIEKARALVSGSNTRGERFERLRESMSSSSNPVADAAEVLRDFEALLAAKIAGVSEIPQTSKLLSLGFTQAELLRARERMGEDAWLDLALVGLDDIPEFEYRVREDEYIPFASASAGQQATALLWTLLNQSGPPLIIDQPEDDLDNQVMPEIAKALWDAKQRRQLIFASHNANLVVNGDAELVVCCGNRVAGEQSSGTILAEGAIDVKNVRDEIARVMEGGREAFDLRRAKYGF